MSDLFSLAGKTILITGASRGLGLAMAEAMAEAGGHVVLNGRVAETLEAQAEALRGRGLKASTAAFDATDEQAMIEAVAGIAREHGRLDVAISNAGIQYRKPLIEMDTAEARKVIETNLFACLLLAREAAKPMIAQGSGRLIFTGSIMGQVGRPTIHPYAAAKGGVMGMVKSLAAELGPHGITVNAIAPGFFATDMNTALVGNPEFTAWVESRTALKRWAQPREIGGTAVYIASKAGSFLTGQTITVDGGQLAMA
jgi:gluconate 5-dehydrogenase